MHRTLAERQYIVMVGGNRIVSSIKLRPLLTNTLYRDCDCIFAYRCEVY
jgi:hypothetical protein